MTTEAAPIVCTLTPGNFKSRMEWIGDLARDGLTAHRRDGLTLHLTYALAAADRVREMVRQEQECCAFLGFAVREDAGAMRVTITAPETARETAEMLFQQFVTPRPKEDACRRPCP